MKFIYKIENKVNGRKYIGQHQGKYLSNRLSNHKLQLNNGTHHNKHLQNSYNKYGPDNFIFELIEEVTENQDITEREQYWIDYFLDTYNKRPAAGSNKGIKLSEEHRKNIGEANRGKPKKYSQRKKRLSNYLIKFKMDRMSFEELLKLFNKDIDKLCTCICYGTKPHKVEVDDLKQEASIKLWELFKGKKHIDKNKNYIMFAIKNCLLSYIRHEKRNPLTIAVSLDALLEQQEENFI
jgi:group I intron endonuclease